MIFSIGNHIELIKQGIKIHTRRPTGRYKVGNTYAIQPCRTCKGIPEGRILILKRWIEPRGLMISPRDAEWEGGYKSHEFETLYESMYPNWSHRIAYKFQYVKLQ